MAVLGAGVRAVGKVLVVLKGRAHSVAILFHVQHVLCESSEPLHFQVMFAEHVLEEATSVI